MTTPYSATLGALLPPAAINRESEREYLIQAIERLDSLGSIFQTVYELTGRPAIGKTVIVGMLKQWCESRQIAYASLDFDVRRNENAKRYPQNYTLMIADLVAGARFIDLPAEPKDLPPDADRDAARRFLSAVIKISLDRPVVLFFDETERLTSPQAEWLEEWVVNPLAQTGRVMVVWVGRRPQRWVRFELRRRLHSREVAPFDQENVKELFERLKVPARFNEASPRKFFLHLTKGNPYALNIVANTVKKKRRVSEPPSDEYLLRETLSPLVNQFVREFAFKDLGDREILACQPLAVVRQFDNILMRELLSGSLPEFKGYSREDCSALLGNLRRFEVVQWDVGRKGYSLDTTVRSLLSQLLTQDNPDYYARVNEIAIRVYQDWIKRAGDNRMLYILEELYQQACLNQISERVRQPRWFSLTELLKRRLDDYPQRDPDLRFSALNILYHELERDPDLEMLDPEAYPKLLEMVSQERVKAIS